jgi:hypothetical protein
MIIPMSTKNKKNIDRKVPSLDLYMHNKKQMIEIVGKTSASKGDIHVALIHHSEHYNIEDVPYDMYNYQIQIYFINSHLLYAMKET